MKNILKAKLISRLGLIGFGLAILLSACGETDSNALTAPEKPCVIVEFKPAGNNALGKPAPTTLVLDKSSPQYCQNVRDDYKAAMIWYSSQVANNTYAPEMDQEFSKYYTGPLLSQARSSLYYNKQAKRVVIGQFNAQNLAISAQTWTIDGLSSTLIVNPGNYSLANFPEGKPDQGKVTERTDFESWQVKLVYDARASHWKISESSTIFISPGG